MSKIVVFSPAKLNLFLHVYQQRNDGFHNLKTYFQLIDLCDTLSFCTTDDSHITIRNPAIAIAKEKDLCYRAAKLLQPYVTNNMGIIIDVEKRIPEGGGLGGGSSNAATVLKTLNHLWNINLSKQELCELALELGSDVPIFIHGHSSYAHGRGEIFTTEVPADLFDQQLFCVIKPNVHASTEAIFNSPLLNKRTDEKKTVPIDTVFFENDFEAVVFGSYPIIAELANICAPITELHLTGTGACLYGLVDSVEQFEHISNIIPDAHDCFLAKGIAHGDTLISEGDFL